jgi:hypothetical protein
LAAVLFQIMKQMDDERIKDMGAKHAAQHAGVLKP